MKQRRKILLALLLSASVAATPVASIPVLAEDLDIASEEVSVESADEGTDTADDSVLADNAESADLTVEDEDTTEDADSDTDSDSVDLFNDGEVDEFSADSVSAQDTTEAKTHSINVTVNNKTTGIYAFKNVIVTKQEDGTYLVRMQSASDVRDYVAFAEGDAKTDLVPVYNHEVDWYHGTTTTAADGTKEIWYTIPVKSLTDPIYLAFSSQKNLDDTWKKLEKKWDGPYLLKFNLDSMADTTEKDAVASDVNKVSATKITLTPKNTTGMFNATTAVLEKDEKGSQLILTLHGQGYHYLYKGTYEEAVANGANKDNWIAGEQVDGKWQFTIPVADGETYLPIVAISNSYLTKYENGQNTLERAFYPRQAVIDENAKTLVTGDYDHTKDLTVSNGVKMFKVGSASLETIGGPNSNNYQEVLHLTMGSDSFDKVFIGSATAAAKAEKTTDITDRKADLVVKANAMGGTTTTDYLEKEVTFSFHSVKNNTWYERVFKISKTNSTLTVTPVPVPATKVTLNATSQKVETGKSFTLKATVTPADTTDKIVWSSSNEAVAKVAADGTVTAVKAGTAVITATAGNVKAECTVTVTAPATKVTLNSTSQKVETGKSFTLKATVTPADTTDKIVWSSSNEAVAKVAADGTVTAVKAGTAVITATAGSVKAVCTVTVADPVYKVTGIKLAATPSRNIAAGKKVQLKVTVAPSNATNKAVTWTTSNKKVATVNSNGVVTFKKNAGGKKVTITATAKDGSKKAQKITLTCMKGSVKSIKLSAKTTLKRGKTTKVKATVYTQKGKANKKVVWSSSNTKLAIVDKNGKVKAVKGKKGTVKITARATDGSGKKATIKIKIK